jgi:acyl-CoA synthetase (NDP forming)
MTDSKTTAGSRVAAVERILQPKSVAIIGISSKPGTAGHTVLGNLTVNDFKGDIHLVGRSGGEIEGRKVLPDISALPEGVDLAIFTLPAGGVKEAIEGCIKRKVGAAVIFASGFSETGNDAAQEELAKIARAGGLALIGPNCLGFSNLVTGFACGFASSSKTGLMTPGKDPAVAIISQSGGLMAHVKMGLDARQIQSSYTISTGNEADLGVSDFIDYLVQDKNTNGIVIYAEDVRNTQAFLASAKRAREAGKPIVLYHSGRGAKAKEATKSHTGALTGDYATMAVMVRRAGIALVDTLEEVIDVTEILLRFPGAAPTKGAGILTFSGAFCAIAYDYCEMVNLEVPPLSKEIEAELAPQLPAYLPPHNPLDLGTQAIWQPELVEVGAKALLKDPAMGSVTVSITAGGPNHAVKYLKGIIEAQKVAGKKPITLSILGDGSPLLPEFMALAKEHRVILSRSSERALRAIAQVHRYGESLAQPKGVAPKAISGLPKLGSGTQPEYVGKQLLAAAGIKIPAGGLAKSADEAVEIAKKVGYPVAMKAQAAALAHKTEAGGVALNLADDAAVRATWKSMSEGVARVQPGLKLDGMLVEKMSGKGVELMIGARRDKQWGPVLLVGLGGIWVEAIGDVRLLPPDLPVDEIAKEIRLLKSAKILGKFRGAPERDVEAVAKVVATIGQLMLTVPEIVEVDINPLVVHAKGEGVTALDALFVTK